MARRRPATSVEGPAPGVGSLLGTVAACSDTGRIRSNNEDNYLSFDLRRRTILPAGGEVRVSFAAPGVLLAVADGMGGHSSGQVASQLCVENLPTELLRVLPNPTQHAADLRPALIQAVQATSDVIYHIAREDRRYEGMGTTLSAALLRGTEAWVAQVGDSRAYLLRQGRLTPLTRDQTLAESLTDLEGEALPGTPFQNMLLQAVGAMSRLDVVVTTTELQPGDFFLLCSDGLYRVVRLRQIGEILARPGSLRAKVEALVAQANAGGGPDNVTALVCEVKSGRGQPTNR